MSQEPTAATADIETPSPTHDHHDRAHRRRLVYALGICFSVFQLFVSAWAILPSQVVRSVHVGFLLALVYVILATDEHVSRPTKVFAWIAAVVGFSTGLYQWYFYADLLLRAGYPEPQDIAFGIVLIVLVFEAARRVMGWALPLISGIFLAYCLFGQYLPSPLNHRGYYFDQIIDHMTFGTEGIYGIPVYVSSSYIFLFILFGAFLERAGMIRLFTDVALGTVGHARGGPAKVAVISSGLMGTISGSGVANVVTTGQFTIPLMKRFGYRPAFAGGVEAVSSMGGQIMPPVMGAVAFIMAETLDVPYSTVVHAALVPAILYFASAFWMVHLEAGKRGLFGLAKEECPDPIAAIRARWFLILPLAALVFLLFSGYTPLFAGTAGLAFTALLILGGPISGRLENTALRSLFWVALGLAAAAFFELGILVVVIVLTILVLLNFLVRGGRETLVMCRDALADGARHALPVGVACAIVGIIIGAMTLTGAATTFGGFVVS
ncbi:MAG TPA: TRAP transporter fused permease subunit, partial [Kaistiaceae bacterium]|nr:TRAP transporter fused permease subunit [Kaistiaceae bacterium]